MVLDYIKLKDIKPALTGYISDSLLLLKRSPVPDDDAIHDIRVLMKKSRAAIKLLATQLDEESFMREYTAYREAGRILCNWRDSSVHRKTLKTLKKSNRKLFANVEHLEKVKELLIRYESPTEVTPEVNEQIEKLEEILKKSAYRLRFYSLERLDPQLLIKELEKSYRQVSEIYLECRNNTKPSKIHEFRKKGKDFLYQLYFFRPLNPPGIKGLEKRLDNLTQNLGKYNDLTQLLEAMEYDFRNISNPPELNEFIVIIKDRQDQYISKVWPSAYKIFCPGQQLINMLGFKLLVI
jgi:CHAD domain-containing protein